MLDQNDICYNNIFKKLVSFYFLEYKYIFRWDASITLLHKGVHKYKEIIKFSLINFTIENISMLQWEFLTWNYIILTNILG